MGLTGLWQERHQVAIHQYSPRCQCRGAREASWAVDGREDFLKEEELKQTVGLEKVVKGREGEGRGTEVE